MHKKNVCFFELGKIQFSRNGQNLTDFYEIEGVTESCLK